MHHPTRGRALALGALACAGLALAALGGPALASTGKAAASKCQLGRTVNLYVQAAFTGASSTTGTAVRTTINGLVADTNKRGGILGCQVKVTYGDSESSLTSDLPLLQKNLSQSNYDFVYLTGFGVPTSIPYLTQRQQMTFIVNGTPSLTGPQTPYIFDLNATNQQRAAVPGVALGTITKYKRAAIIVDNTATGLIVGGAFTRGFENHGGKVIHVERAPATLVDWTPVITRARAANPDVLFYNLFTPGAGTLLKAIKATGWNVPVWLGPTTGSVDLAPLLNLGSAALKQIPVTVPALAVRGNSRGATLIKTIKANGDSISLPLALYAQANDVFACIKNAIIATKSLNKAKISRWLEQNGKTKLDGLSQSTSTGFSRTKHILQIKPGDWVVVPEGTLRDGQLPGPALSGQKTR